ncbi:hypothetical protein VNI00_005933 [Paramarasmius palmivorus]|uniref:NACHT domain-containing protein n=1 Tax=Paramarasmius palmivorus TaxID=297713 RepID=A0AAW0DAY6_9AGAR
MSTSDFRIKGLRIDGFPTTNKKLTICIQSPDGAQVSYLTDMKEVGDGGCQTDFHVPLVEPSETLSLEVYRHRSLRGNTLLASVGISREELVGLDRGGEIQKGMVVHKKTHHYRLKLSLKTDRAVTPINLPPQSSTPNATAPLEQATDELSPKRPDVDPGPQVAPFDVGPQLDDLRRKTDKREKFFGRTDALLKILGELSENDIARAAYIAVSGLYHLVTNQHHKNKAIVELYDNMVETYRIAVDKDALNKHGHFSKLFEDIVKQSQECYIFLSSYMVQDRLYKVMDFWDTPSKIAEFNEAFKQLREQFFTSQIKVTTVAVLTTQKAVESLDLNVMPPDRKETLRTLEPTRKPLGPKSHCLPGTRRSTLEKIQGLVFGGKQSILWISGIAGCGKSSLIGTLHDLLSKSGFNSRLAAFIRFDRTEYRDAREFVKTLAYLLANFDERLGKPIAEAIRRNRTISQSTELSVQVQDLLINPLRGLSEELAREGPLVVLVDGIDECSRSDRAESNFRRQMLELFADDAFKFLPFIRFVLASRPEEDIVDYLQYCDNHVLHFPLDHMSEETRSDIRYFLTKSFKRPFFRILDEARRSSAVELLAERASGLFIWASTVIEFIQENVVHRLNAFTKTEPPKDALYALSTLYETTLDSLVHEHGDDDIRQNMHMALGLIMAFAQSPVLIRKSHDKASILPGLFKYVKYADETGILGAIGKLRSLVTMTEHEGYQLLHKSFDDFLTSNPTHRWYIDVKKYEVILTEATISCMIADLEDSNREMRPLPLYRYAARWSTYYWEVHRGQSSPELAKIVKKLLLQYAIRWLHCFDHPKIIKGNLAQRCFGAICRFQIEQGNYDSEFLRKAWLGASRLEVINKKQIFVQDFFFVMLYDAARDSKVIKAEIDGQDNLTWEVDNIYMSVYVSMANGSHIYEEILAVMKKKPLPPIVSLGPEIQMPIRIVSEGKITMDRGDIKDVDDESTKGFIEWTGEKDDWYSE